MVKPKIFDRATRTLEHCFLLGVLLLETLFRSPSVLFGGGWRDVVASVSPRRRVFVFCFFFPWLLHPCWRRDCVINIYAILIYFLLEEKRRFKFCRRIRSDVVLIFHDYHMLFFSQFSESSKLKNMGATTTCPHQGKDQCN
jgi:hypothetical protein